MSCVCFAGVKNEALREEFIEKAVEQADGGSFVVYVPNQKFVVKRRD
jgi:hypothetical protein